MADSAPAANSAAPATLPEGDLSLEDARDFIYSLADPEAHQNIEGQQPEADERDLPRLDNPFQLDEAARQKQQRDARNSSKEDADPDQPAPREEKAQEQEPEQSEEDDVPPLEPPRSWTKEAKEVFAKLPRELQEEETRIATAREAEFRRSQNELADQRKAVEAEREAMAKARSEYESKVPSLVRTLESALQAEFGDIKTLDDVKVLQRDDPFRFQQWQVHQMQINAAKAEQEAVDRQKAQEEQTGWAKHVQTESETFAKSLPEADRAKLKEWNAKAPDFLEAKGFTRDQLTRLANGEKLSIYDHRVQSLILDGMKYQAIAAAPKAIAQKPVPTVQKPGTNAVASDDADLRSLSNRLDQTGSEEDAWRLYEARLNKASRRR